jgi:hypothetical protein
MQLDAASVVKHLPSVASRLQRLLRKLAHLPRVAGGTLLVCSVATLCRAYDLR